jgi:hypothetical protein
LPAYREGFGSGEIMSDLGPLVVRSGVRAKAGQR